MSGDPFDELRRGAERFPPSRVVRSFDVDFDVPMRHTAAEWLLTIHDAFRPVDPADTAGLTRRVGAYWCRIVSADVRFLLPAGLAAIAESSEDAERLAAVPGTDAAYAAARWADGAGKLLYRTSSHARGRMLFEDACTLADARGLWWCKPDMLSNFLRSQLQEAEQAGNDRQERIADLVDRMRGAVAEQAAIGGEHGVPPLTARPADAPAEEREFVRGTLSLAHNLSIVLHRLATLRDDASLFAESGELAERGVAIARATGDGYREAQASLQQAQLLRRVHGERAPQVRDLLGTILRLPWERGKLIAGQQIAQIDGGRAGFDALVQQVEGAMSRSAGVDLEIASGAARRARELLAELPAADRGAGENRLRTMELRVVRSVRQVIALPGYKRAYAGTVRPVYLDEVRRLMAEAGPDESPVWEDVLGLVEESTGRELLDLMSSSALPRLEAPEEELLAPDTAPDDVDDISGLDVTEEVTEERGGTRGIPAPSGRRGVLRRSADAAQDERDRQALIDREEEFERQFLRHPVPATAYDPEIADKADRYVVNNPGSCLVRYFVHSTRAGGPEQVSAFVVRDGIRRPVACCALSAVRDVVNRMLTHVHDDGTVGHPDLVAARAVWDLLLATLWPHIAPDGEPLRHLVVVPTEDLFAVPFHVAIPDGGVPLGARVPLSLSVSLSAFLQRGRSTLRFQRVDAADDLSAMVLGDYDRKERIWRVTGDEVARAGWPAPHLHLAGSRPPSLSGQVPRYRADWAGLAKLSAPRPEFFVYAGHGRYLPEYGELGPWLEIGDGGGGNGRLTSYDVAMRLRLPRNRLTILGACLAGQGGGTSGGDVAGFLRAFMAAGAGAIALPLWSVFDSATVDTAGLLLRRSREALSTPRRVYDVVATLHEHYAVQWQRARGRAEGRHGWIERMPLALYT